MKKFAVVLGVMSAALLPVHVVGATSVTTMTASAGSALAGGTAAITFTVRETGQFTQSTDPVSGQEVWSCSSYAPASTGSGNVFYVNGAELNSTDNMYATAAYSGDADGNGTCISTFKMKSSVAESKTVTLYTSSGPLSSPSVKVIFTKSTTTSSKTTVPTTSTTTSSSSAKKDTTLAAPTLKSVTVDGVAKDPNGAVNIKSNQSMILSGKTVANGVIDIEVHSNPTAATVTAGKDGSWTYTVSGLEAGDHTVYATVTDPLTKKTSPQAVLLSFGVEDDQATGTAPGTTATTSSKKHGSNGLVIIVAAVVVLAAIGGGAYYFVRRRRGKKSTTR